MKKDYIVNVRIINHRKRNIFVLIFAIAVAGIVSFSVYFAKNDLPSNTKITQSRSVSSKYNSSPNGLYQTYKTNNFTFQMSPGWSIDSRSGIANLWQTGNGANYQTVQIFEDNIPTNFAVNHALVVTSEDNKLKAIGAPSDNCATFTNSKPAGQQQGSAAKWQGASFNCDLNNPERDTVGTTSAASINSVTLVSPKGDSHNFFFLYTDHAIQPNYGDFEELINSFKLQ